MRAVAPDSSRQWVQSVGGNGVDTVSSIAADSEGNVLIGGTFDDDLVLGEASHASLGDADVYVAKLTSSGYPLWSASFGSDRSDRLTALAVDKAGNVVIAGSFVSTITFGPATLTSAGGSDVFVGKLDAAGGVLWATRLGGEGLEDDARLAVDQDGNVVVVGVFSDTMDLGTERLTSAGETDVFIARLSHADGTPLVGQKAGGGQAETAGGVAVAPSGLMALAGNFSGKLPVGSPPVLSRGSTDAFILKLSTDGR